MWYMNEERELMRNVVREFVENEVRPVAMRIDQNDEFPLELMKRAGELGFLGVTMPKEYGGLGSDYTTMSLIIEEISKSSPVLAVTMIAHSLLSCGMLERLGTPEQKEKYLTPAITGEIILALGSTEAVGGSNILEHSTRAVLDGDQWVINGGKVFISNIICSDVYLITALTSDIDPVTKTGLSFFIVEKDTPGFELGKPEHKLGWHGSSTGSISFKNCRIPKENLLGPLGGALQAIFFGFTDELVACGTIGLGIAEAVYEMALQYNLERIQCGQSLYDRFQVTRHKFVKMFSEIESLRALVYSTCARQDAGDKPLAHGRMLKVKGAEVAEYVSREAIQLFGGVGTVVGTGVERYWRDAKVLAIGGGSVEAMTEAVAMLIRDKMV